MSSLHANGLERRGNLLDVFAGYIFDRIADLVDDALQDLCFGITSRDALQKAHQVVHTRYQNILYPAILQLRHVTRTLRTR